MPSRAELAATTADGVTLRIDHVRHARAEARRGVVICLHAMMTDGRYFGARRDDSFAATLAAAGHDVLVPDFRGHGRSVPPHAGRGPHGDWSFDDLVELDLPAIVGAATNATGVAASELAIVGHSLGGLVTIAALGTGRIPSPRLVILPATSVWLVGRDGPRRRRALMALYRGVARVFGKAPIRALRQGTADEARTYIEQLTGWTRAARWTSLRGIDYGAAAELIATPVVPIVGDGDWMCTPDDARGFAAQIPTSEPLRIVGRAHGDAISPDHFQLFTRGELRPRWLELAARLAQNGEPKNHSQS